MARFGSLLVAVGVLLMTAFSASGVHLVGLGLWFCGAVLLLDSLIGGGTPAQFLWAAAAAGAVYAYTQTGVATWAIEGDGRLVVAGLTVPLAVIAVICLRRG